MLTHNWFLRISEDADRHLWRFWGISCALALTLRASIRPMSTLYVTLNLVEPCLKMLFDLITKDKVAWVYRRWGLRWDMYWCFYIFFNETHNHLEILTTFEWITKDKVTRVDDRGGEIVSFYCISISFFKIVLDILGHPLFHVIVHFGTMFINPQDHSMKCCLLYCNASWRRINWLNKRQVISSIFIN